jgi:parvulin-like peptidyl-prolyl isomerase
LKKSADQASERAVDEKAAMIRERLLDGEDFRSLAREFSEDFSARTGGDLGYLQKNQLAPKFLEVLSAMKPGDVSPAFRTDSGVHILKLEEVIHARNAAEIREEVRRQLTEEKFFEKYRDFLKGLRENARIEVRL